MRSLTFLRLAAALSLSSLPALAPAARAQQTLQQATTRIEVAVEAGEAASQQTHAALLARRQMLLEIFRRDPASARAYALPLPTRQALLAADPTTAPLLEYELTQTGELAASVADNWNDGSSQTLYTLHTPTAELDLALPPAALATAPPNHHLVTVRGLALAGVVAADTVAEASPAEAAACATPVQSANATAPNNAASSAPLTCSTFGNQRIAVLIVKFPAATPAFPTGLDQAAYWNQVLFGATPSVASYWNEVSQGQTSATGDVYGPFQLSQQYDCTSTAALQTAAISAAASTVDFSQYNRIVIVYPVTSCTFGGLANVGCVSATSTIAHQYSVVWLPVTPDYRADFTHPQLWGGASHELGHNLGLNHANTLDFNSLSLGPLDFSTTNPGTVTGTGAGSGSGSNLTAVNTEYGDTFDVMGYPWISGGPYNAVHRSKILGWIPPADERDITTAGTYSLVPAESATGLRALHVLRDPTSTSWLWVEFHQPTGAYESANFQAHLSYGDTETTGAQIHYESPLAANSTPYTYLLDMTPQASATGSSNNFYDGNLAPGKSWSDPYSLLTLTAGQQTSAALAVTVAYDTPCATVALSASTIPAAGGTGLLNITAPSSCAWTVSSNALWISFPGSTSGSGSAAIPFVATANPSAFQRNTYLTAQRQSLPLVQSGSAVTLLALAPNAGSSVAGTAAPFTLTYSDAAGLGDVSQLNLTYTGFGNPDCHVAVVSNSFGQYLYLYSNGAFSSGIALGSAGTLTSPSCTLSGAASSYQALGNNASLTLGLTFTGSFLGEHNIFASAYTNGSGSTASVPLGVWSVTSSTAPAASTTTLSSTPSATATLGQTVNLSAAVLPASATGQVTFADGATPLGSATLGNGVATFTTSTLALGSHALTAVYAGDSADAPSTSAGLAFTVTPKPAIATTTTVSLGLAQLAYGAPLQLAASVTPAAATGLVAFQDSTNPAAPVSLASANLKAGTASTSLNTLAVGTYKIGASYAGDGSYAASASLLNGTVTVSQAVSSVAVTASPQPVSYGNPLTLNAAITSPGGTGTVTFYDNATSLGKVPVVPGPAGAGAAANGTATLTLSTLSAGTHSLSAVYSGDANVTGSTSPAIAVVITPATSTVVLTPSALTVIAGTNLSLSAAVTPIAATGPVLFSDYSQNNTVLPAGSGTLVNGIATVSLNSLALGPHTLGATYGGDANDAPGNSNLVTITVVPAPATTTTLAASAGTILSNGAVLLTAHVLPGTGAASPTGNVSFADGSLVLATVALNAGAASYTATGLAVGNHTLSAAYAGSAGTFSASAAAPVTLAVQDFALSFPGNPVPLNAGTGASFPLTLTPGASGFSTAIALTCTGAPAQSTCSIAPGTVTPGSSPATATLTLATTARPASSAGWLLLGLAPALIVLRRRTRLAGLLAACAACAVLLLASGCGQGNFAGFTTAGTPAGTYTLTVTSTASAATSLTHTTTFTMKVN